MKQKISDWYWNYGIQRGTDPADPDRALRRISVGDWFDAVAHSAERVDTLQRSLSAKSCIALWGPSQTGKSTLLSRYLPGGEDDASASPLTWDPAHPILFWGNDSDNRLVFNPYNWNRDASGVVTRYTLASTAPTTEAPAVNPSFPIEFKIGTRVSVLHAFSLGYLTQCKSAADPFKPDDFLEELGQAPSSDATFSREAFDWLRDVADVLERLKDHSRFAQLFSRGDWARRVRPALVSSPRLLASPDAAKAMVARLLWDSSPRLTALFEGMESLRTRLASDWEGTRRILLSPEVAKLVLDIDTCEYYLRTPKNEAAGLSQASKEAKVRQQVDCIACSRDGDDICVSVASSPVSSPIRGAAFGTFQALCSEIVVPLRREAFPAASPMLRLLEKHDLLDFPGLSRGDPGGGANADNRLDPDTLSDVDFFKVVLKHGRTQSIVFKHIDDYAVDSFVIFNKATDDPPKWAILNEGVLSWIHSFDPDWKKGSPAPLPVFINLTFFNNPVNTLATANIDNFWKFVDPTFQLSFADKRTSRWFITTYPHFETGKITVAKDRHDDLIAQMADYGRFTDATGLSREDIKAVFGDDGGTDRMISALAGAVDPSDRRKCCTALLRRETQNLASTLSLQLPTPPEAGADARRRSLAETAAALRGAMAGIEAGTLAFDYASLARIVQNIFSAPPSAFDPIPVNLASLDEWRMDEWLKNQLRNWFDQAEKRVADNTILDAPHQRELLCALRDNLDLDEIAEFLDQPIFNVDEATARAARTPFAIAFGNLLRFGGCSRSSDIPAGQGNADYMADLVRGFASKGWRRRSKKASESPYVQTVIDPALRRIDALAENAVAGTRPPQPGDDQLRDILEALSAIR